MHHLDDRLDIWEESILNLLSQLEAGNEQNLVVASIIIEQLATINEMKYPRGECS